MCADTHQQALNQPTKMLVVDGDQSHCDLIDTLFSLDFHIDFAKDGASALQLGKHCAPDIVLVDYNLPDMTGPVLCDQLSPQLQRTHAPILFTTSEWNDDIRLNCRKVGGADVIRKPVVTEALRWRVLSHVKTQMHAPLMATKSVNDELTHALNAKYINQHLQQHLLSLQTADIPITLSVVDINQFKQFDNSYAYLEGDDCLMKVAEVLKHELHRPADLVCRIGGDKFLLVLPGIVEEGFIHIADNIHNALRNEKIHLPQSQQDYVTVSIGAISFRQQLLTATELLSHADEQLFIAKSQGPNQTRYTELD
jgi:diguanylate cyclase (GGDEF)-like protein